LFVCLYIMLRINVMTPLPSLKEQTGSEPVMPGDLFSMTRRHK